MTMRPFGAHMSIAGGLHKAFDEAGRVGCDCMQIFVKNQRQWQAAPLSDEEIRLWNDAREQSNVSPVVAHDTYLINLASPDPAAWKRSIDAFTAELTRCEQLSIPYLVTHPGSHMGSGEEAGLKRVAEALNDIHKRTRGFHVQTLLETTAGQGSSIGCRFEHLAAIIAEVREPQRLGVCVDTCHIFAAGYAITKPAEYAETMHELDRILGHKIVKCFHVNDSMRELGSRVDRHDHIGKGKIGRQAFVNLVTDPRYENIPMILETPKEEDSRGRDYDRVNLAILRRMRKSHGSKGFRGEDGVT